ncbi:MAG: glycosyltransferase family 4 protein [Anaerolineae bacterium]|nr:glycosyltransferase family 4 protein [Anaerolineae bacterium]
MRILMCHNLYRFRGGEESAKDLLTALLRAHGHEVVEYPADSREIEAYGPVAKLGLGLRILYSRQSARAIRRLVAEARPDVAHVHNVFPLLSPSVYVALHDLGVPVVQTINNFRLLCPNGLFFIDGAVCTRCSGGNYAHAVAHRCLHGSLPMSAAYAASLALHWRLGTFPDKMGFLLPTNHFTAQMLARRMRDPSRLIVMPYPIGSLKAMAPRTDFEPVVVYMGRLSVEKGVSTLVEAMARTPELTLRVIGEGPARAALEAQAAALGLRNVAFLGFVPGAARFDHVRAATCLVQPSVCHEQYPMAVAEAMALGVPVVASRMGGMPELVLEGETGLLFEAGRADELAAHLKRLAADPALVRRVGAAARAAIARDHDPEAYYARLMDVYRRARAGYAPD